MKSQRRARTLGVALAATLVAAACSSGNNGVAQGQAPVPIDEDEVGGDEPATSGPADTSETDETEPSPADGDTTEPVLTEPVSTEPPASDRCNTEADDSPTTIRVWHSLGGMIEPFGQELAERYMAEHPDVTVEMTRVPGVYTEVIDLLSKTDPQEFPDILMGSNLSVRLQADSDKFVSIEECNSGDRPDVFDGLLPSIDRTYTVDNTLWAAPFNISTPILLYDKNRWTDAGLDIDNPPETTDELIAAIRQMKDSGVTTTGIALYDESAGWLIQQAAAKQQLLLAEPANGHSGDPIDKMTFDHPSIADTLERFRELHDDGYIHWIGWDNGANSTNDLIQTIHPIEPTGMTLHTSGAVGDIIEQVEGGLVPYVEIGVGPFPGAAPGGTIGGGAWWLVDTGDPTQVGTAWSFVEWMVSPEIIAELSAATGYVPTTPAAASQQQLIDAWETHPILKVGYDQVLADTDTDTAAGLQVGPAAEVARQIELAAAFTIEGGADASSELQEREQIALEVSNAYETTVNN